MSAGQWATAAKCWRSVIAASPDRADDHLALAHALHHDGRRDEAEQILSEATCRFPDSLQVAAAWAQSAQHNLDWGVALDRWRAVEARFGATVVGALGQIDALRGAGLVVPRELVESADRALGSARARGEDSQACRRLSFEVAFIGGNPGVAREAAERLTSARYRADAFRRLAQLHWRDRNFVEAKSTASEALASDPTLIGALVLLARVATENGDGEAALDLYAKVIELSPDIARWRLRRIDLLNWMGRLPEAVRELDHARRTWPHDQGVRDMARTFHPEAHLFPSGSDSASGATNFESELQAIARRAPSAFARPPMRPELCRDVLPAPASGAGVLVFIFTGANDALSIPPALFDRFLATVSASAVYLKDFQRLRYLKGIQSLAHDYSGTVEALRDLADQHGAGRLVTMGNCAGATAALRYGIELGAQRIIAFDPLTYEGEETFESTENGISFLRRRLLANDLAGMADLRTFIESRPSTADIQIHYNEDHAVTRDDALRLAGLPGVTMFSHSAGKFGASLRHLAKTGDFERFLAGVLT